MAIGWKYKLVVSGHVLLNTLVQMKNSMNQTQKDKAKETHLTLK